jgi:cytochrome c biogenesis protein CcmG, thiol:disulfide interchange protein DsbE
VPYKKLLGGVLAIVVLSGIYFLRPRPRTYASRRPTRRGMRAPNFSLPQLSGSHLELSSYRGKVILLDFWATWCDPCRDEIPRFVDLQNKFGPQGLQIIGISMDDSPDPVRDFYQRFKMNYPVVMGNAQIGQLYGGVLGLPIAFLIARNGGIYTKLVGATDNSILEKEIVTLLKGKPSPSTVGS